MPGSISSEAQSVFDDKLRIRRQSVDHLADLTKTEEPVKFEDPMVIEWQPHIHGFYNGYEDSGPNKVTRVPSAQYGNRSSSKKSSTTPLDSPLYGNPTRKQSINTSVQTLPDPTGAYSNQGYLKDAEQYNNIAKYTGEDDDLLDDDDCFLSRTSVAIISVLATIIAAGIICGAVYAAYCNEDECYWKLVGEQA